MNQKQIVDKIAREVDVKKSIVAEIVEKLLNITAETISKGEKVRFVGFGNFLVRTRAPRVGRNPQTGAKIDIPSTKLPAFIPGINFKKEIKGK